MHPHDDVSPKERRLTRVLLLDPHFPCRRAMQALLECSPREVVIAGEASLPDEAQELLRDNEIDVIFLGLADGPLDVTPIATLTTIAPKCPILVYANETGGDAVARAFNAGASGYLTDLSPAEEVLMAVRVLAAGHPAVDPALAAEGILWATRHRRGASSDELTPREREVMQMLTQGLGPRAMAEKLHVSRRTVEFHLAGAYRKLKVHSRVEALTVWMRLARSLEEVNGSR